MGAGGVALAAATAHAGGGEMGQTAAYFLILHAAALLGVTACARAPMPPTPLRARHARRRRRPWPRHDRFQRRSHDAARAFAGARLFPLAAPIGGSLMILAWLALAAVFIFSAARRRG